MPAPSQEQITIPSETLYRKSIWGDGHVSYAISWHDQKKQITLNTKVKSGKVYPASQEGCNTNQFNQLVIANCGGFSVLLDSSGPLLVSYPDYNRALIKLHSQFKIDGQLLFLVQMGLKAADVFGLLSREQTGWSFTAKPVDYALLC